MSGNPYSGGVYSYVPPTDETPLTYPPPPTSQPVRPGPVPLNQPGSASIAGAYELQGLPTSSTSQTFSYTDSPKGQYANQSLPSLDQHDFTAGATHGQEKSNRWSYTDSLHPPVGARKFSRSWWKYNWKVQVSRRRLPRLLYGITGFILLIVWLAVAAKFAQDIQYSEAANSNFNSSGDSGAVASNNILFFLSGQLNTFDPQARNLNIDWSAFMVQGPVSGNDLANAKQVSVEAYDVEAIAMFRDTVARADAGFNQSQINALGFTPFRVKDPNIAPTGFLGISDFDSINTDIGLGQKSTNIYTQPEFGYPLDVFKGTITFVAADNGTITSSRRPGSGVVRMEGAILTDNLLNLKTRVSTNATCLDPLAEGCELIIDIWVERTGLVKFCVAAVFIINWVVTIAIFLVTGEALLLNRNDILEGTDILAVCFTALFALPTVRSLLPGVPDYGCLLDLIGILPCVIVVTLCTTFFANHRLRMRSRQASEAAAEAAKAQ